MAHFQVSLDTAPYYASYENYMQRGQELSRKEVLKVAKMKYANVIGEHRLAKAIGVNYKYMLRGGHL
ncbi:hypothetical protein T440DRAFT_468200 [Plenodomus tracheiphilus IPT5]|uniref:Uncharacterized protein n=1 Tax=Plenodomus tracheiphilus IPT5 TaxID=1408161 RepID=A0A6A7B6N0_9PLEO|nr:hypothetical protein T440DRAFT_468200 [Plenodomus tracheiphilus IPT5]